MTRTDPTQSKARRDGGCLRGCLITTLVLVVLLVLGGVVAYVGGRTYIARSLPEWRARYPAVRLATSLLQLREGLGPTEAPTPGAPGRQEGAPDRALLPADIPVFEQPVLEAYAISQAHVTAYQRLAEPYEAVLDQMRASMRDHGWELAGEEQAPQGLVTVWIKGERDCQVEVSVHDGASELWLRCSGAQ